MRGQTPRCALCSLEIDRDVRAYVRIVRFDRDALKNTGVGINRTLASVHEACWERLAVAIQTVRQAAP